jgi:S-adenosyl-L-methionine hydrolase (adenosine-forming)
MPSAKRRTGPRRTARTGASRAARPAAPHGAGRPGPPLVTLLSDFGGGSGYPAQMKAVLLSALPDVRIVDLSHEVPHFDVLSGALLLEACVPRFPPRAVHCAVVDPGVGTARRGLCVVARDGRRLVGPDNGILTPFLDGARIHELSSPRHVPSPASATFHGRDLFAPVAAWLAGGGDAARLGPAVRNPVRLDWPAATRRGDVVEGACLAADPFGNVVTSIRADDLGEHPRVREVLVEGKPVRFAATYGEGRPGELLAMVGSGGRLEIAAREGSAARELSLGRGARVEVHLLRDYRPLATPHAPARLDEADMAPPGDNKRRANRLHHELPVAYRTVGSFLTDWATNISQGGLFINTRKPLPVGTVVKLIIQLPSAEFPFDITGRVTRVTEFDNHANMVPGMGIEFTDIDPGKREKIEVFVEQLRRDLGA